jgi:TRAP-type uncharacterized transport system fused permease subunit
MLASGKSPNMAGFIAIASIVAVGALRRTDRLNFRGFLRSFEDAAKGALGIVATCATAGIVIGIVTNVGVGVKLASSIMRISQDNLLVALFMVMVISIILGMGLPTTAAYVITVSVAVPSIIGMGVSRMAANLFTLYFACLSSITPPVAVAAYAAAGLSGGDAGRTGWIAMRLGIAGFIVPFLFVYGQPLLMEGTAAEVLITIVTSLIGISALSVGMQGWLFRNLNFGIRILYLIAGVLMTFPGYASDAAGALVLAAVTFYLWNTSKKNHPAL